MKTAVKANKLECATCKTQHAVNGPVDKIFKPSALTTYLVNVKNEHYEKLVAVNEETGEMEGICECMPQPKQQPPVKKGEEKPIPDHMKVHMSLCYHCQKTLCDKCRSKHYAEFKEKPLKALEGFQEGSGNVLSTGRMRFVSLLPYSVIITQIVMFIFSKGN